MYTKATSSSSSSTSFSSSLSLECVHWSWWFPYEYKIHSNLVYITSNYHNRWLKAFISNRQQNSTRKPTDKLNNLWINFLFVSVTVSIDVNILNAIGSHLICMQMYARTHTHTHENVSTFNERISSKDAVHSCKLQLIKIEYTATWWNYFTPPPSLPLTISFLLPVLC